MFARLPRTLGNALLDVVVPRRCGLCGRFDSFLCAACEAALPVADAPRCPTCWGRMPPGRACGRCATVLVHSLDSVRGAFQLEEGARRLVHALKYDGLSALAEPMGGLLAASLAAWGIRPDVMVPVPLHPARERWRGFNQAALLARFCAEAAALPHERGLLRRCRATSPQVRVAGVHGRQENVAGAFAAQGSPAGLTVLLVDDVCTTGATLRACADVLLAAGARRVYGLTFAHED